jgi:flagellar basal-body rod protein FlgC
MSVDPVAISRTALDVEWQRMQLIAQNLANENTTRVAGGGTYRPLRLQTGPDQVFNRLVEAGSNVANPQGVKVLGVFAEGGRGRRVYDPTSLAS